MFFLFRKNGKSVVRRCVNVTSTLSGYVLSRGHCHPNFFCRPFFPFFSSLQVILALLSSLVFCCCLCCVTKRDEKQRKKGGVGSLADKDQDKASVMTTRLQDDGDEVSSFFQVCF